MAKQNKHCFSITKGYQILGMLHCYVNTWVTCCIETEGLAQINSITLVLHSPSSLSKGIYPHVPHCWTSASVLGLWSSPECVMAPVILRWPFLADVFGLQISLLHLCPERWFITWFIPCSSTIFHTLRPFPFSPLPRSLHSVFHSLVLSLCSVCVACLHL